MIKRIKVDETMDGVRRDDELVGWMQPDGSLEEAEVKRDGAAIINVAWVPQETDASVDLVLDRPDGNSQGFGAVHGASGVIVSERERSQLMN
ncbi:hypothetical protein NL676_010875 [Syzygium grande]|nr:hypothetical protein NL676_010875 [Syzygium grande]